MLLALAAQRVWPGNYLHQRCGQYGIVVDTIGRLDYDLKVNLCVGDTLLIVPDKAEFHEMRTHRTSQRILDGIIA